MASASCMQADDSNEERSSNKSVVGVKSQNSTSSSPSNPTSKSPTANNAPTSRQATAPAKTAVPAFSQVTAPTQTAAPTQSQTIQANTPTSPQPTKPSETPTSQQPSTVEPTQESTPEQSQTTQSSEMSGTQPKAPEQQGCGQIDPALNEPKILTSPMPEPQKPSNEGCGHVNPELNKPQILTHPMPEQQMPQSPGCGGMNQVKPEDLILKVDHSNGATKTWTDKNDDIWAEGDLSGVDVRFNEKNKGHIFKDRPGHLTDTPENRTRINDLVKDPTKYLGPDKHDNWWYGKILPDGTQLWGEARGDKIINCGINEVPQEYNPDSGLCNFDPSKQKNNN